MHEDEAAALIADALKGKGVSVSGEPKEGKLNLVASRRGLLKNKYRGTPSFQPSRRSDVCLLAW